MHDRIVDFSTRHPKLVFALVLLMVAVAGAFFPRIRVDTDPENMLPKTQVDRVFHDQMKKEFSLYDMIVVGVTNDTDPQGVFNPHSLTQIDTLTRGIAKIKGVVREDILAPSSVDNIEQGGPGVVRFQWLMREPPKTPAAAVAIREAAQRLPMLNGTVVSDDGRAIAIYVPIVDKNQSYRIAGEIKGLIGKLSGDERYFITGLPVAEDTFGVEMFEQMAISAPLAALVIFLLMWWFFRSLMLISSPLLLAMATVIATMGLLIGMGFPVHIMSSMIPIFLMPIAVVDSVHILSEFSERYPQSGDARTAIDQVMHHLFTPMLYTSLTSAVGFASLAATPIPPVRVFGLFVAFGICLAFVLTITFIPAFAVSLSPKQLAHLASATSDSENDRLARGVRWLGQLSLSHAKGILVISGMLLAVSAYGISLIQINDNPVKWFRSHHPIRIADRVLNQHFAGTYMAYLVLEKSNDSNERAAFDARVGEILASAKNEGVDITSQWQEIRKAARAQHDSLDAELNKLYDPTSDAMDAADEASEPHWEALLNAIEQSQDELKFFQTPASLRYIAKIQDAFAASGLVGKSNSLVDLVKTVSRELHEGDPAQFVIPNSSNAVAQTILTYQSSHRPQDVWHMVTPDFRKANIWLQLKSGDNQDTVKVTQVLDRFLAKHPLPPGVRAHWAGLTYINIVWQKAMVSGMLRSLLGSFAMVFLLMIFLFRSFWFGLLAMVPLSLTITLIYGVIGLVGKDYDMPVAVLSALTLGLSVDFAIHFLQRARTIFAQERNWNRTATLMFEEPGRAIARNAIVIAIGFLPLLAAPLVPYNTVGFFMAAIMAISSIVTVLVLPAVGQLASRRLFGEDQPKSESAQEEPPCAP